MYRKVGFTLIELSIVIVIIGLLVGGIIAGQAMIENAKTRAVINEKAAFENAFMTFRVKFNALPGDMKNPERFWPDQLWNRNAGGNQNGLISWAWEGPEAWRQLALAKLITATIAEDTVTAVTATGGPDCKLIDPGAKEAATCPSIADVTAPRSRTFPQGMWTIYAGDNLHTEHEWETYTVSNMLRISRLKLDEAQTPTGKQAVGIMPVSTASSIDRKMDDGYPVTGRVRLAGRPNKRYAYCMDYDFYLANNGTPESLQIPYLSEAAAAAEDEDISPSTGQNCVLNFNLEF